MEKIDWCVAYFKEKDKGEKTEKFFKDKKFSVELREEKGPWIGLEDYTRYALYVVEGEPGLSTFHEAIWKTLVAAKEALIPPRDKKFFELCEAMNEACKKKGHLTNKLFDCGELGFALAYWGKGRWEVRWFDEATKA